MRIIGRCRRDTPISNTLPAKHGSHRTHWMGWLGEYEGPGYYGRKRERSRSAKYIYQHLHCAPMVIWLAELAGVDGRRLRLAVRKSVPQPKLYKDSPSAAAMARRILPWTLVHQHLMNMSRAARLLQP